VTLVVIIVDMSVLFRRFAPLSALLCPAAAAVASAGTTTAHTNSTGSPLTHAALPHNWDTLSDGFPGRLMVFIVVMAVVVSIFLVIAAFGPKRFNEYRPADVMEKYPLELDDEDEADAEILFDAGHHKLLRKSGAVA
jgi:hypothetical protein